MNASVLKICQDMTTKLIDLERKAQHRGGANALQFAR